MKETKAQKTEIPPPFEYVNFQPYTKVILDTRKRVEQFSTETDDFYSVKLRASFRVRYLGEEKAEPLIREFPFRMYCTKKDWNKIEAGNAKGEQLEEIYKAKGLAEEKYHRIKEDHTTITAEDFARYYTADTIPKAIADANTVGKVYDVIIAEEDRDGKRGNANAYRSSKSSVLKLGERI